VISIVLVILDWTLNDKNFKTVSKVLRGIFRFLRLFLVFRKVLKNYIFLYIFFSLIKSKRFPIQLQGIVLEHQLKKYWKF